MIIVLSLVLVLAVAIALAVLVRGRQGANAVREPDGLPWERMPDNPSDGQYRWRPGAGSSRWDPYAPEASRRERVRSTRRTHAVPRADDLYVLLGVDPSASDREIERAYRKRVAEWHPDRFHSDPQARAEAERQLRRLNAGIAVLRDPLRRAHYNATR